MLLVGYRNFPMEFPYQGVTSRNGVFRVPWLHDLGMHGEEITEKQKDPYVVGNHVKGPLLGHSLLDVQ